MPSWTVYVSGTTGVDETYTIEAEDEDGADEKGAARFADDYPFADIDSVEVEPLE